MSPRATAGVLILAASSLSSLVITVVDHWRRADPGLDMVTRHERRFAALRSSLPPTVGAVSYLSEPPLAGGDVSAIKEYVLTVYTLAPVVVDPKGRHPYVIGNFPGQAVRVPDGSGLVVQEDFGDGVVLFRAAGR
jgi:hypothetical protein